MEEINMEFRSKLERERLKKRARAADCEDITPIHASLATLSNRETLSTGLNVTESDVCVWPPVLLGRVSSRDTTTSMSDVLVKASDLSLYLKSELQTEEWSRGIKFDTLVSSIKTSVEICSLFVFPSDSAKGYLAARHIDQGWSAVKNEKVKRFTKDVGWKLSYATVRDMRGVDPERQLVKWIPLCSETEHNLHPSSAFKSRTESDTRHANEFSTALKEMLQGPSMKPIERLLADADAKASQLRAVFTLDGEHFAQSSLKRLASLGGLGKDLPGENGNSLFTSKMRNRGVELEQEIFQLMCEEEGEQFAFKRVLEGERESCEESVRKLVAKLNAEMMELLVKFTSRSLSIQEALMLSRLKVVKHARRTEEVSALPAFLSTQAIQIAERVYKDALHDQDQQHARERENQEQKLKAANEEHKNEVAVLSTTLQELREAKMKADVNETKSNQECCICYRELEEFSLASGHGESSSSAKKLHRRACFLPCMHANVCSTCSDKRWNEGPRSCPLCRHKLTMKPRVVYL